MKQLDLILKRRMTAIRKFGYSSVVRSTLDDIGITKTAEQNAVMTAKCKTLKLAPTFGVLCIGLLPSNVIEDKQENWDEIHRLGLHKKAPRKKRK